MFLKKHIFFLLTIWLWANGTFLQAQNLVPNGSFENFTSCPNAGSQFYLAIPWIGKDNNSVDYFNSCAPLPYNTPYSGAGFQLPKDGVAYAAFWAYNGVNNNYREYAQIQLVTTLTTNDYYFLRFFVNQYQLGKYSVNGIGAVISSTAIGTTTGSGSVLSYSPSILKYGNPIISDTLNWIEVSGIFKASGNEYYLTIGNFFDDINTDTLSVNYSNYPGAYYYLDDVSLINITTPQWQYRDTSVVLGDSVLIGPAITGLNVDWYTSGGSFIKNAPGIYVKPTVNTSYNATETFNSAVYNHTINVTVLPTNVNEYEQLQNSVKIFPNPCKENFTLHFDHYGNETVHVSITDISGKEVHNEKATVINRLAPVNAKLEDGIYFVIVRMKNGISTRKLIVQ